MKRIFFIALISVFTISACKKDQLSTVDSASSANTNKTETMILNFKDKLVDNLKDETIYSTDSAVWYVEALLNYTYGNTTSPCANPIVDTTETIVNTTGENGFTLAQLADVFDVIEAGVINNKPDNTTVFAVDLYSYPAGNLTVFAGRAIYAPRVFKSTSDTSGYWYFGYDDGMCGADSGLYLGMDATDILEKSLNTVINEGHWIDIETFAVSPIDYTDPNFPFTDPDLLPARILLYDGDFWIDSRHYCMSPELIAYYSSNQGIPYIINDLIPKGKIFLLVELDAYVQIGYAKHVAAITYGTVY